LASGTWNILETYYPPIEVDGKPMYEIVEVKEEDS
jgi:hypothetical protein